MTTTPVLSIDLAQARELLARAVETQGRDFVYNPGGQGGCLNFPDPDNFHPNAPQARTGCLIGTAVTLAGVEIPLIYARSTIGQLHDGHVVHLSQDALIYLKVAQRAQDTGKSWGRAHDLAEQWATGGIPGVPDRTEADQTEADQT